jgi:hypothetical protein
MSHQPKSLTVAVVTVEGPTDPQSVTLRIFSTPPDQLSYDPVKGVVERAGRASKSMNFSTRIDPKLPTARRLRSTTIDGLMYQLPRLAEGALQRLIDVTKDRLKTAFNDLTPQEVFELDSWLGTRVRAAQGEARLRWGFVRGVFNTVRQAHEPN